MVDGLRSEAWYAGDDRNAFIHRAWMRRGLPDDTFEGKPHIAICSTWSDLSPCNRHLQEVAEQVSRGVWEAARGSRCSIWILPALRIDACFAEVAQQSPVGSGRSPRDRRG